MKNGTPTNAVITPIGSSAGTAAVRAVASARPGRWRPSRAAQGTSRRWSLPQSSRTACGTTRPTNPITPLTATASAASSAANPKQRYFTRSTRTPSAAAVAFADREQIERASHAEQHVSPNGERNTEERRVAPGRAGETPHHPEDRGAERFHVGEGEEQQDRRIPERAHDHAREQQRPRIEHSARRGRDPKDEQDGRHGAEKAAAGIDPDAQGVEMQHDGGDRTRGGAARDAQDERDQRAECGAAPERSCRSAPVPRRRDAATTTRGARSPRTIARVLRVALAEDRADDVAGTHRNRADPDSEEHRNHKHECEEHDARQHGRLARRQRPQPARWIANRSNSAARRDVGPRPIDHVRLDLHHAPSSDRAQVPPARLGAEPLPRPRAASRRLAIPRYPGRA